MVLRRQHLHDPVNAVQRRESRAAEELARADLQLSKSGHHGLRAQLFDYRFGQVLFLVSVQDVDLEDTVAGRVLVDCVCFYRFGFVLVRCAVCGRLSFLREH